MLRPVTWRVSTLVGYGTPSGCCRSHDADGNLRPTLRHSDGPDRQFYREHAVACLARLLPPPHQGRVRWIHSTFLRRPYCPLRTYLQRNRDLLFGTRSRQSLSGPTTTTFSDTINVHQPQRRGVYRIHKRGPPVGPIFPVLLGLLMLYRFVL